ncbi:MAG: hypothetical protein ACKVH8_16275 [Pirellulales bacterium]
MPQKRTASSTSNPSDLIAAAELIIQRDEERRQQDQEDSVRDRQQHRQDVRQSNKRMLSSIEVIKWCAMSICTVWVVSFIISIYILIQVKGKIAEVEVQVDRIRHVISNPMATAGARFGQQIDDKMKQFLTVPDPNETEQ